jgi:hypothetical protein
MSRKDNSLLADLYSAKVLQENFSDLQGVCDSPIEQQQSVASLYPTTKDHEEEEFGRMPPTDEDFAEKGYTNLGWQNGWDYNDPPGTPQVVKECYAKGHHPREYSNPYRQSNVITWCPEPECRYVYHTDAS